MANDFPARHELAAFLRSRRERLRPEDVDLKSTIRRRTPGLRREEVAQRAGIGVTWYTWLEQGRNVRPSPNVAAALADALRLTPVERSHMYALLHHGETTDISVSAEPLEALARQIPSPAYVRDDAWDLIFWNEAAHEYFDDFGPKLDGRANLIAYLFLNQQARWAFCDWAEVSSRSVAQFRKLNGACAPGSRVARVVEYLRKASREFAACWDSFLLTDFYIGQRILRNKAGKDSLFTYATLTSPNTSSPLLTLYLPLSTDDSTRVAMGKSEFA